MGGWWEEVSLPGPQPRAAADVVSTGRDVLAKCAHWAHWTVSQGALFLWKKQGWDAGKWWTFRTSAGLGIGEFEEGRNETWSFPWPP